MHANSRIGYGDYPATSQKSLSDHRQDALIFLIKLTSVQYLISLSLLNLQSEYTEYNPYGTLKSAELPDVIRINTYGSVGFNQSDKLSDSFQGSKPLLFLHILNTALHC